MNITIGIPLGGNFTVTSNISYLMKGWYERSFFNVVKMKTFVLVVISEPGDHNFPNLLLCSTNFVEEQYLSFLVFWTYHFIASLLLV